MKKVAMMIATVATLAAVASAPAEARGVRVRVGTGVAIAAAADGDMLEHVHFSRLAPSRVLAVVVTRSGLVRDRVLALDLDVTDPRQVRLYCASQ